MSHLPPSGPVSALAGKHIVITRPTGPLVQGEPDDALARQLRALGAQVTSLPLVTIQPVPFVWEPEVGCDWIFFTSQNAVRSFVSGLVKPLKAVRIAAVGPVTAACVRHFGYTVDFISPDFNAESAAQAFRDVYSCPGLRIVWPCGNLANQALKEGLQAAGASVLPIVVYHTSLKKALSGEELEALRQPVDMLVFTSPSAVDAWVGLYAELPASIAQVPVACLGPKTALSAKRQLGQVAVQASPHTLAALGQAISVYFEVGTAI